MYSSGIRELEAGIRIDLSEIDGEEGERARRLQQKMKNNLQMVCDRKDKLGLFMNTLFAMLCMKRTIA